MDSVIIAGLGNPGTEYAGSRHNVGFMVLEELSARYRTRLRPGRGDFNAASIERGGREIVLLAPTTYMNNSGLAVADALQRWNVSPSSLLVVVDDFWLPLGMLRYRTKGSDGGHNGLASIIYSLNDQAFPRLRCGIGREVMPPKSAMADFVLSPFETEEEAVVKDMVERAADAAAEFAARGSARPVNPSKV